MEDETKKWTAAIQTLTIFEHNLAELKKKLTSEEQARRSADSALEGTERQVEDQRRRLREATEELNAAGSKWQPLKNNWRKPKG